MYNYLFWEAISAVIGAISLVSILIFAFRQKEIRKFLLNKLFYIPAIILVIVFFSGLISNRTYPPNFAMPPFMHSEAMGGMAPSLPFNKIWDFFKNSNNFEIVSDIGTDPNEVPEKPMNPDSDGIVRFNITAKEVIGEVAPDIYFNYWTFNGKAPGPMLRIKEGDTVELSLTNDPTSLHNHNIDLHAVTGPGGGATLTNVAPGETKTFRWKALNPGLYVYHCATANVSTHNANGQYGLILV